MILFCDSSALLKLYVVEAETDSMLEAAAASEMIAVCRVTWAECMAAMARRVRENPQDQTAIAQARERYAVDWPQFLILEVTQELVELAGEHADTFALRAYDSIQLAAILVTHLARPGGVKFACFDTRLAKAARVLGIEAL